MEITYDNYEQDVVSEHESYCTRSIDIVPIDDLIAFEHQLFDDMDFN